MLIKATLSERVDVDVRPEELVSAVLKLYDARHKREGSYIDPLTRKWLIFDYTHPHNGDDHFREGRKATKEEIFHEQVRHEIEELLRNP